MITKVLIVDDEGEFLTLLADYLTEKNMSTQFAANLGDAREILRTHFIDVLVTDVMVNPGGLDATLGFIEFAKTQWPWLKVIAMTGIDRTDVKTILRQNGVDGVIIKPFALYEMAQLVVSVMASRAKPILRGTIVPSLDEPKSLGPERIVELADRILAQHTAA